MPAVLEERAAPKPAIEHRTGDTADIKEMWRTYRRYRDVTTKNRLINHYMRTHVRPLAERLHSTLPQQVDVDDLIQQGYLGLAESIDRFDVDRDVKFETFSARRIFGSMRDYLRAIDPMPRLARTRAKRLEEARESHRKRHGRPPSDDELSRRMDDLPPRTFNRLMTADRPMVMVSFHAAGDSDGDGGESDAMEALAERGRPTPLTDAERDDLKRWVTTGFGRRDHLIIVLYYYEHLTMREVGEALGLSESRVSQRLESILARLRARMSLGEAEAEFVLS